MVVKDIIDILEGEIICEGDLDQEIKTACGSDMMSDVLAFVKDQSVLLTGLVNPQVVRTAELRGKRAGEAPVPVGVGLHGQQNLRVCRNLAADELDVVAECV